MLVSAAQPISPIQLRPTLLGIAIVGNNYLLITKVRLCAKYGRLLASLRGRRGSGVNLRLKRGADYFCLAEKSTFDTLTV
jgi:hypothetical protein